MKSKRPMAFAASLLLLLSMTACSGAAQPELVTQSEGEIFLFGETHAEPAVLEEEFSQWKRLYDQENMRHLFVEYGYCTGELLNLWMAAENDDLLDTVYDNWEGTFGHDPSVKEFHQRIKKECPETIYHGVDVEHQHATTGEIYLDYLRENGLDGAGEFSIAEDSMAQGEYYNKKGDVEYRENKLAENFVREFEKLEGESVMGIFGSAHTGLEMMTSKVPSMGNQLRGYYGESVHSEDLSFASKDIEPIRTDTITVDGKEYEASYYGKEDLTGFKDYTYREFWRLENAYQDFKDSKKTGDTLPYSNYPMLIEEGQVFIAEYGRTDGSVERWFFRSDGDEFQGETTTTGFKAKFSA